MRGGARVAIAAFLVAMLVMAIAAWIGYDYWWAERYY
jgi:hypothetical protein